jgi:nucleoside-diphosphate-sugar epimerase
MRVFVAGGSGTIGVPLVRALTSAGHQVIAMTRSAAKQAELRALGAIPVVADALDREAVHTILENARPTHVIHELTALPKEGARRVRDLEATNRLRIEGTRNLLGAAIAARVRRFIGGSFALFPDVDGPETGDAAADANRSMERQIRDASRSGKIEGIVLRYGLFYGSASPSMMSMVDLIRRRRLPVVRDDHGQLPIIHLDDAVSATVAALDHGLPGCSYDIVDDRAVSMTDIVRGIAASIGAAPPFVVPAWIPRLMAPYMARMTSLQVPRSNAAAKRELEWRPRYPTLNDGLAATLARVA